MTQEQLIKTAQRLHPEQDYIFEIANLLGYKPKIVTHDNATKTCYEKADLLGWPADQVIKALYLHDGSYSSLIGIITPEFGKQIDTQKIIPKAIPNITFEQAKRYNPDPYFLPEGMAVGTCTPFPYASDIENIQKIIIINHPTIDDKLVDISVGGKEKKDFKTSMHIEYKGIYDILKQKFNDKIIKI